MADKKISQLDAAAALTGTELVPIVQSGATVKTTVQDIADKAPIPTLSQITSMPDGNVSETNMAVGRNGGGVLGAEDLLSSKIAYIASEFGDSGSLGLQNINGKIGEIYSENLTDNRVYQLPDASGTIALTSQVGLPYSVYSALITYESAGIEVVTLLQNTLGATITFGARSGSEFPINASSSVFTSNKTIVIATQYWNGSSTFSSIGTRISGTQVKMQSVNGSGVGSVSYGYPVFIEIRVYP